MLSGITPEGQVTLPRSIMKSLGIDGGNEILIEVENGRLVLKKLDGTEQRKKTALYTKQGD